ncbi:Protein phosphatase 4 core regulatory subunit R2 [Dillenia turbinata]|uniref:Protein phosphatase 4 core regulatory subunit R2 n=1 Tax=Dillenia turbinata TaxID=194707 RepID=A0AAN8ZE84_9MAGN
METATEAKENSGQPIPPSNDAHADHVNENLLPHLSNHDEGTEPTEEINGEEVRGVLQVIAATGKFWHDWDKLKTMLSFQLKQVLLEYPEAKMASEEQVSSLGETFPELVRRLDEALHSFTEGPPFTLQRLCEILLAANSIYPNLSKLALALEKNLLVTSTLIMSTDPYPPPTIQKPDEPEERSEEPQPPTDLVQNGVEPAIGDRDEIMTEVEEAEIDDGMTIDMEAFQEIVVSTETNSTSTEKS